MDLRAAIRARLVRPAPATLVALGLQTALALVLAWVPLFDLLGYEFSAALGLLASATAGPLAIGVARRAGPDSASPRLFARAWGLALACLLPALAVISLNALRVPNCNPLAGAVFFLLLPVAGSGVACAWGLAAARLTRRRLCAGALFAAWWLLTAAWAGLEFWQGPQVDSYNALTGWLAGPIYDEVVEPGGPLLFSRLFSLAASLGVLCLAGGWSARSRREALAGALCLTLALGLGLGADRLGFGRGRATVEAVLSQEARCAHFVLRHDPDLPAAEIRRFLLDCEFRYWQLERLLGPVAPDEPIRVYLFPSPAVKRRLVGAAHTQYAKPWQRLLVLNAAPFPHPTLLHELTHVYAGAFGSAPSRVSARCGVWINLGLTEGLAVAADWQAERSDLHGSSAAMRRLGQAPDLRRLFDPVGFWQASARRSYTVAGSFVRYLLGRYGAAPLRAAYAAGRLDGAYPRSAEELIADWEAFLDARPLEPLEIEVARARFSRPSLFERRCAHEVAALRSEAATALAAGRLEEAARLADALEQHLPQDRDTEELRFEIDSRAGRCPQALQRAEHLREHPDGTAVDRARLAGRLGDMLLGLGQQEQARARYAELLAAHLGEAADRLALVKLEATARGAAGERVLGFLRHAEGGDDGALALLDIHLAALADPTWAVPPYLLGRALFNRGQVERAVPWLERACDLGLGAPGLATEGLHLLAEALVLSGHGERAAPLLGVLRQLPLHAGSLLRSREWLERLAFAGAQGWRLEIELACGL